VQANPEKAGHYFQLAANQGNRAEHFNLGIFTEMGLTWIKIINKPGITLKWQKHAII
jgi:TPR repeat protein